MSTVLAVLLAVLLLWTPGILLSSAVGLRGWVAIGSAGAVTLGYTGAAVTVTAATGLPWNLGVFLGGLVVLTVALGAVARPWRWTPPALVAAWRPVHHVAVGAAVLAAGAAGGAVVVRASGTLSAVPQGWDAMFHAGAIRQIADTGSADPATLAAIAQPENSSYYYPDTYHALAALVAQLTSLEPDVIINAFSAITPLVFAAAIALLAMVLSRRPAVTVAAAGVSALIGYFPYNMVRFGPLWPFGMAIAVAPALLAVLLVLIRAPRGRAGVAGAVVLGLCLAGLLNTHASVAFAFVLWGAAQAVPALIRRGRSVGSSLLALLGAGVLTLALIAASLGPLRATAAVSGQIDREPFTTPGAATQALLNFGWENPGPQWWLAVGLLAGVLTALVRRYLLPTLLFAVGMGVLFVLSAAVASSTALTFTSYWWDDPARFAALFTVPAVLLIAAGVVEALDLVVRVLGRVGLPRPGLVLARPAVGVALVAVFLVLTTGYLRVNRANITVSAYPDGPTLSRLEVEGLRVLAGRVGARPDGAAGAAGAAGVDLEALGTTGPSSSSAQEGRGSVMNDPFDGSAWGYAMFGLDMVFRAPVTYPVQPSAYGADRLLLEQEMNQLDTSRPVQDAVRRLGVRWVVAQEGFVGTDLGRAPGLLDLGGVRSLDLVYRNPDISVYRVDVP